ncbi:MAG: hypothetical protein C0506_15020 [Anaerolinea sp.]|nr:hypothetical protein [Anaerolinea sp.]
MPAMTTSAHLSDWSVERHFEAFLDGPDSPDISNPIHSTAVANAYGFKAALVGGVTVWGWCARAVLAALGDGWLDDGWAEVNFRQPVYPGDSLAIRVGRGEAARALEVSNQDGEICIRGAAGRGLHPAFPDFHRPTRLVPEAAPATLPELTLEGAPVGRDLRPMLVPYQLSEAAVYVTEKQRDPAPPWLGEGARIHPGWIAARMTPLMKHSYHYGPSIHTQTLVQNLAPALAGQWVTVAGVFVDAFERKGHHYGIVDGLVLSEAGAELGRLRHATIFRPRPPA